MIPNVIPWDIHKQDNVEVFFEIFDAYFNNSGGML